ncbi:hypothetical protein Tsubulata_043215, partial [Turnera subulata]
VFTIFTITIADGVDIISVSLGRDEAANFTRDAVAIGSFHAMEKGILTVQSAGKSGPRPLTVGSVAPWILTVAAATTDCKIIDKVVLGNGNTLITGKFLSSILYISNFAHIIEI